MKKSSFKIAAVLVSLAICLTAFAACSNHEDELFYKEGGKLYYRPNEGEAAYELATDDNGETLVDAEGNLLWKVTDANGEDQTHPVSMPGVLENGKTVACQQFSIEIPKDWTSIGDNNIMLQNEKLGVQIDYLFYDGGDYTAESEAEKIKTAFSAGVEAGQIELESDDVQVAGRDAKRLSVYVKGETADEDSYMELYYIDAPGGMMAFTCAAKADSDFNFKSILDTIEYRV